MAEILGAVASGISVLQLAGQVAKSVIKLKDYWDQIKEAPAEIVYLLQEIESLNLILGHIKDDQSEQNTYGVDVGNVCVQQSLELCRQGADELEGLVVELAQKIEGKGKWRGKMASAKVVLKKEEIKRLKRRMKNAIRLLSLAYQFHTNAMIQLQPDIIAARVATHMSSLTVTTVSNKLDVKQNAINSDSSNLVTRQYNSWTSSPSWTRYLLGHIEYEQRTTRYKRKERQEFAAKYVGPRWALNQKVFQILGYNTLGGCQISLKTYRIVPDDSPIFNAVEEGDLRGVQMLLDTREAFVTDTNQRGETPLHIAAEYGKYELCKLFISNGADSLATNNENDTPLHALVFSAWEINDLKASYLFLEISRLLLTADADDALLGEHSILKEFQGPLALFQPLQHEIFPSCIAMSAHTRFDVAFHLSCGKEYNTPYLVRKIVSNQDQIDLDVISQFDSDGEGLFHAIAFGLSHAVDHSYDTNRKDQDIPPEVWHELERQGNNNFMWRELLKDFLTAGAKDMISNIDNEGRSPFRELLCHAAENGQKGFSNAVSNWLHDLRSSGVDLLEYGTNEREYLLQYPSNYEYCGSEFMEKYDKCPGRHWKGTDCSWPIRLIALSYGPEPEDWVLWFDEWTDRLAGEFWACIEDLESDLSLDESEIFHVPGAWD